MVWAEKTLGTKESTNTYKMSYHKLCLTETSLNLGMHVWEGNLKRIYKK